MQDLSFRGFPSPCNPSPGRGGVPRARAVADNGVDRIDVPVWGVAPPDAPCARIALGYELTSANPKEKVTVSMVVRRRLGHPPLPDQAYWARTPPRSRTIDSQVSAAAYCGASSKAFLIAATASAVRTAVQYVNPRKK